MTMRSATVNSRSSSSTSRHGSGVAGLAGSLNARATWSSASALRIWARTSRLGTINLDVLAQIRNADALLHVARAFSDPANPATPDPWRDVEELDLEFTVADLMVIEKRLEKLKTQGRHGSG